jgi:single-stranded-DNA-specific exonuclease
MLQQQSKRWVVGGCDKAEAARFASVLGVTFPVAALLIQRGVTSEEAAHKLFNPSFATLHAPALMDGMTAAVERILRAVDTHERILVYGDYDVDGTTGTVVLRRALNILGAQTGYHIPNRFTEGYGINRQALQKARDDGYTLIISVDCGIRAHEPLQWAHENNLDCIVTDHHLPDGEQALPPAVAVLNPNKPGCPYPDKHLAGVGVAFKLAQGLLEARGRGELAPGFLKMVALGTVADMAPLVSENRIIVQLGLRDLPKATNHGLRALMEVAGCDSNSRAVDAGDIGFRLGPRINAAGRMDAARAVVELFEAETMTDARRFAAQLDEHNRNRQTTQRNIVQLALAELDTLNGNGEPAHVAVVTGDGWHRGVIGLAASKVAERAHRPCIVISFDGDTGHGSARSAGDYHLLDGLTACGDLFERFGGHAQAAGLVVNRAQIPELRRRLSAHAASMFGSETPQPVLKIDLEIEPEALSLNLVRELSVLEPFGAAWSKPIFATSNLRVTREPRVMKDRHLKLYLADDNGKTHEAVWWNALEKSETATPALGERIELAYCLEQNFWQGNERLQLVVQDLRRVEGQKV